MGQVLSATCQLWFLSHLNHRKEPQIGCSESDGIARCALLSDRVVFCGVGSTSRKQSFYALL